MEEERWEDFNWRRYRISYMLKSMERYKDNGIEPDRVVIGEL